MVAVCTKTRYIFVCDRIFLDRTLLGPIKNYIVFCCEDPIMRTAGFEPAPPIGDEILSHTLWLGTFVVVKFASLSNLQVCSVPEIAASTIY